MVSEHVLNMDQEDHQSHESVFQAVVKESLTLPAYQHHGQRGSNQEQQAGAQFSQF